MAALFIAAMSRHNGRMPSPPNPVRTGPPVIVEPAAAEPAAHTVVLYKLHPDFAGVRERWTADRHEANFARGDFAAEFELPPGYRLDSDANVIRNGAGFQCPVVVDAADERPRLVNLDASIDQEPALIPLRRK